MEAGKRACHQICKICAQEECLDSTTGESAASVCSWKRVAVGTASSTCTQPFARDNYSLQSLGSINLKGISLELGDELYKRDKTLRREQSSR